MLRPRERFRRNDWPTLGVELELQLVDAVSLALKSAIDALLEHLPAELHGSAKPELMQCFVEVTSDPCRTVDEVGGDLTRKLGAVERAADRCGTRLLWAATHPFSHWRDQQLSPGERYARLVETLQVAVVRHVVFGLHVHVGVRSGDRAARLCDRLQRHLPVLLALSVNSPFWCGRPTGLQSHRIEVLADSPIGGPPPRMRSWRHYLEIVDRLFAAGCIRSVKDLWWDVRPNPAYGTVEVRICDMPPDLPSVLGLTALIQCLVADLSEEIDRRAAVPEGDPLLVRQNRWRACRYGPGATFVDPVSLEATPARRAVERLVERLRPVAERLGSGRHLDDVLGMAAGSTGSERQVALHEQAGDLAKVVRRLVERSRLTPQAPSDVRLGWPRPIGQGHPGSVTGPSRPVVPFGIPVA
jgi:carboxylate-amine ligase